MPPWLLKVWNGNLRVLRAVYLFDLAAVCNCPPPMTWQLTVVEFARLIDGIDRMRAQKPGG